MRISRFVKCFFISSSYEFVYILFLIQKAEKSLIYYKGYRGETEEENKAIKAEFDRLKAIASEKKVDEKIHLRDFRNISVLS